MEEGDERCVVGGVDTHKDLHVAAVVDERDRVLASASFAATRQGYRQMLAWMRSFGTLQRVGVESTGSYGAGLLRFLQQAGIEVLEVTTPDAHDRRRRGKSDDFDAQSAAHAAFAGTRTVTPRSRDGMVESLRVLCACRKTAVAARRIALQMIHNTIVCAPDGLREALHPNPGGVAARPDGLPRRRGRLPDQPEIPGAALSGTARRDCRSRRHDWRHRRRACA
jgi:transposase